MDIVFQTPVKKSKPPPQPTNEKELQNLAKRISEKIAEGDVRGAARMASSEEKIAPYNEETLAALRSKHPAGPPNICGLVPPFAVSSVEITEAQIRKSIASFPMGSSGGPDGLRPQHLNDLISFSAGDAADETIRALTSLANLVVHGNKRKCIRPLFCGGKLCAFAKPLGGIRPIVVGFTVRRLIGKAACKLSPPVH